MAPGLPQTLGTSIVGRAEECALLDGLIREVRGGKSRALVLRGEAGIGKTALLRHLVESAAAELTVLRAVGVESEMELAYAGLHLLLAPILDRLETVPAPQRQALEIVFGLSNGAAPDRFLVGLGALSLVSEAAEERPLLCVVDDAQWLDQASAMTLAFIARRLLAEPVGIVFATREPGNELQHLPQLEVDGLRDADARELLGATARFMLDERTRDRLITETRGHPLALLELSRGLKAPPFASGLETLAPQALPKRIEDSFVARLERLPEDTRLLLLIAAAEPVGDPLLLWRAAERRGIDASAAVAAEADGLLEIDAQVRFRHPLVRSAVYRSASVPVRRTVHQTLADVTDPQLDPDRRAWHLAAAAAGPDEHVASELASAANRVEARGGTASAAAFLERAVALSADPALRAQRALAAALAKLKTGDFDGALAWLGAAEAGPLDELGRAQVGLLRGEIAFASGAGGDAPLLLLNAARWLEPLDAALARETYLEAWVASMFAGRFAGAGKMQEISRVARSAPAPASRPRASDLLLTAFATMVTEGRTAAVPMLTQVAHAVADGAVDVEEQPRWDWTAAIAAIMLWDDERWHAIATRQLQSVRDAGLLLHLPIHAQRLAIVSIWHGDFSLAASLIAEADAIASATGTRVARYAAVMLAGFRGSKTDASRLINAVTKDAELAHQGMAFQWCNFISAILYNGLGEYEKAIEVAAHASEEAPELFVSMQALPEVVEAATRTGKTRLAVDALERLRDATSGTDTGWALGTRALCEALLSEGEDAEVSYRDAIARFGGTRLRPELARAHLLYGEWLRRQNRRVDARAQLRIADDLLTSIGMEAFAERARRELLATGARVRKRTVETRDELTSQERQIARLAREGLSNPEIGARLFLSPRTVEWHLSKVFGKLGIRYRQELANAMDGSESELA